MVVIIIISFNGFKSKYFDGRQLLAAPQKRRADCLKSQCGEINLRLALPEGDYEDSGLRISIEKPMHTIEQIRHSKKAFLKPAMEYMLPTRSEWFRMAPVRT